jgi:hypothetical protein
MGALETAVVVLLLVCVAAIYGHLGWVRWMLVALCLLFVMLGIFGTDLAGRAATDEYRALGTNPNAAFFDGVRLTKKHVFMRGVPFFVGAISILFVLVFRRPAQKRSAGEP